METSDVLIIGSGVAALQLAVSFNSELNVKILTKSSIQNANSYLAQGGIAAAIGMNDDPSKHISDTLEAGRFHNNEEAVREILNEAPQLIGNLAKEGNLFDKDSAGHLLLGLEGAHSEKRIVHSGGDATGRNVVDYLVGQLTANIKVEENQFVYELIVDHEVNRCIGVKAKDQDGTIQFFYGDYVILATGGCGQLYPYTSAAPTVTGDGIAMAYLAGVEMADMEFVQFHPTLLYQNGETKGLISEAVRGEGAILVTEDGTPVMDGFHPLKDLAPRHVVSQMIFNYIENGQDVYLDIQPIRNFKQRFPSITKICENSGIDLSKGRIPVAPGSHFLMGGIQADLIGRTSLNGLFAIGEAACTGLHGANRLASNSLLEGLYQGKKLSEWINSRPRAWKLSRVPENPRRIQEKKLLLLPDVQILKNLMMKRVGIVRSREGLVAQKNWLEQMNLHNLGNLDAYSIQDLTSIFLYINAYLITNAALTRTESRGGHLRSDFPNEEKSWCKKTIIQQRKGGVGANHEYVEAALVN